MSTAPIAICPPAERPAARRALYRRLHGAIEQLRACERSALELEDARLAAAIRPVASTAASVLSDLETTIRRETST